MSKFLYNLSAVGGFNSIRREFFQPLKVHKNENFFGSDFEFSVISLLVMLK